MMRCDVLGWGAELGGYVTTCLLWFSALVPSLISTFSSFYFFTVQVSEKFILILLYIRIGWKAESLVTVHACMVSESFADHK